MIEGARLWPWRMAAQAKNELAMADCESCMQNNPPEIRQHMGCGYLLPLEGDYHGWQPPAAKLGFRQNKKTVRLPTVCPGYSTNLPEVLEIVRGHRHWAKASLRDFCGGEPSEALLIGIEVLESEINAVQQFEMTPESEGGGRK